MRPLRRDHLPVGLGLETADGKIAFIFPAGTRLPAEHSEVFVSGFDRLELTIYSGIEPNTRDSLRIGRITIVGPPKLAGVPVRVAFALDEYGELSASAEALGNQLAVRRKLKSSAVYLSERYLRKLHAKRT